MSPVPFQVAVMPAAINFLITRGASYAAEIELFQDEALTEPFDLRGWKVYLEIDGLPSIVVGGGLTVTTPADGVVDLNLTAAQTRAYSVGKRHCVLWAEKNAEEPKLIAAAGVFKVSNP